MGQEFSSSFDVDHDLQTKKGQAFYKVAMHGGREDGL